MVIGTSVPATSLAPLLHGGDLTAARCLFPNAPAPFIDLSTGINPHPYPLPAIPDDAFTRLPDRAAIAALAAIAARAYGAPGADHIVPAPGTQVLLPVVARLRPPGRAVILGPTYAEHLRAAALAGHDTTEVNDLARLGDADLAFVVNPNNPDGRIVSRSMLIGIAAELDRRRGILIVDEAFADVMPADASLADETGRGNIVVLRSFGKFFGLAGLRLGFAIAAPDITAQIEAALGPWAVSGPAMAVGAKALPDEAWKCAARAWLAETAQRLDRMLLQAGLEIVGGTALYRLTASDRSAEIFNRLGHAGIVVRRFVENERWLRWGLPKDEDAWQRLAAALT